MKKFSLSSIVGARCENPECEVHGNSSANYYRLQFDIDGALLKRILAAQEAFVANKFEGYLTFDINSEVAVTHYELVNNEDTPITERKYKDLKWVELAPEALCDELYFHFDIDHNGRLGFTVDGVEDEDINFIGVFDPIKSIIDLMDLGHPEWPEGEMRSISLEENIASPSKEVIITKPVLH